MADLAGEHELVAIDVEELEKSMLENLRTIGKRSMKKDMIYRVFHSVRRQHNQDYDPQLIAIGPFHRENEALKPMEQFKWTYLRQLIRRNPKKNVLHNYLNVVNKVKTEARSYYSEPLAVSDKDFVEMMVLDGCFLIEYLVKAYMGENRGHLNGVNWSLPLLQRDLLLLENQFPYPILQLLYDCSDIPDLFGLKKVGVPITLLELAVSYVTGNKYETLPEGSEPEAILHILHVYHMSMRPTSYCQSQPAIWGCSLLVRRVMNLYLWLLYSFFHVITCHMPRRRWTSKRGDLERNTYVTPRLIPTATQLLEFGVTFKERKDTRSILDIRFDKEAGIMEIPMLKIQDATISLFSLFRNLVAFEQCCPNTGDHFTSHASLMDSLIDNAADVSILKHKQIIDSKTDEDKEVADFFNNLCKGSYLNFEDHCFLHLFKDVTDYCNISHRKKKAELMPYYNYFRRPWAIFSLFVSIFLLVPTLVQTFFAIYGYYRPPYSV